jgi:hypothetical protein
MLNVVQIGRLMGLSLVFWLAAALYIDLLPRALTDPIRGTVGFAVSLPVGWLSVVLTQYVGRLAPRQLLSGVGLVGALAMMIDGMALRWFPAVYGSDPTAIRLGAAWLLWGYGVSLAIAVCMASRHCALRASSQPASMAKERFAPTEK